MKMFGHTAKGSRVGEFKAAFQPWKKIPTGFSSFK